MINSNPLCLCQPPRFRAAMHNLLLMIKVTVNFAEALADKVEEFMLRSQQQIYFVSAESGKCL